VKFFRHRMENSNHPVSGNEKGIASTGYSNAESPSAFKCIRVPQMLSGEIGTPIILLDDEMIVGAVMWVLLAVP